MKKEPVDMHKILEKNIASFNGMREQKAGILDYHPDAKEYFVRGDEVHLFNTISSLLDNAFKYSAARPVIKISTANTVKDLIITIADNGIRINDTEIIFEKFTARIRATCIM